MKKTNKKLLGISCLVLALAAQSYSQNIMVVNRLQVDGENVREYLHRENTYWKEVARKAISEDRMTSWAVYQRIGGFDVHKDHNYAVVNTYTPEQFAKPRQRNTLSELFPDVNAEDIRVNSISTRHDLLFYRSLAHYQVAQPNVIRVNFSKADKRSFFRLEPEIWGPYIDQRMKAGNTKVVSWSFASLIIPRGSEAQHDAISVDGFNSVSDAIIGDGSEGVELPENIGELMDAHHKATVHLYRLVASSEDETEE